MFHLLRTCFLCHGKEPSIEFTYDLIISLTSTTVLVGRDLLTFTKSLRGPDLPPLGTTRLYFPSFNFPVLSYKSTNPPGQYLDGCSDYHLRRVYSTLNLSHKDPPTWWQNSKGVFYNSTCPWETIIEYYLLLGYALSRVGTQQPQL